MCAENSSYHGRQLGLAVNIRSALSSTRHLDHYAESIGFIPENGYCAGAAGKQRSSGNSLRESTVIVSVMLLAAEHFVPANILPLMRIIVGIVLIIMDVRQTEWHSNRRPSRRE